MPVAGRVKTIHPSNFIPFGVFICGHLDTTITFQLASKTSPVIISNLRRARLALINTRNHLEYIYRLLWVAAAALLLTGYEIAR
jgi:hypothetical protein